MKNDEVSLITIILLMVLVYVLAGINLWFF